MARPNDKQKDSGSHWARQHGLAIGLGALVLALLVAGTVMLLTADKNAPRKVQQITIVNIVPPPPPPPPPPQKIILRGVHFDFDKAVIRPVDRPVLDEAAETLKSNPNVKVEANGYCDAIGTPAYNLRLSQRRAEAVATYLEDKGIPASQLVPQGFGKTHFVATNSIAEGRAENRRVELVPEQ